MTLQEFINKYDKDGAIVLLEGKRNVLFKDKHKLISLGKLIASKTSKIILRSGNLFIPLLIYFASTIFFK